MGKGFVYDTKSSGNSRVAQMFPLLSFSQWLAPALAKTNFEFEFAQSTGRKPEDAQPESLL